MTYENTKLRHAMYSWINSRCTEGFGETYCGDLLNDFVDFIEEIGMMKQSPGRVVFGRELARLGLEKRKIYGQTFWAGIRLRNGSTQQAAHPQKYAKYLADQKRWLRARTTTSKRPHSNREKELAKFHDRLKAEEKLWERIKNGEINFNSPLR